MSDARAPLRLGLFMSLAIGHRTQYLNWQRAFEAGAGKGPSPIEPTWIPVDSGARPALLKALPARTHSLLRTAIEWQAIRAGFRREFDAVFFNPQSIAMKHERQLKRQPYFLSLDATRRQFNTFHPWFRRAPSEEGLVGGFRLRRQQRILQHATRLFPCSQWCASSLIADYKVDPARIVVVPLGIDPQLWRPTEKPRDGVVRLLFIGGDFERKGGDLLLRWARETSRRKWEMHIVTRTSQAAPERVFFHRFNNNSGGLIELANRCDLFVLPTRADCSALSLLESMSVELPSLTTTVGGIREIVVEGKTGQLIPPDDYAALHASLDALIDHPEHLPELGRAARQRVLSEFTAQTNIRRALDIIQSDCR